MNMDTRASGLINLAPGGAIPDIPENRELLERIERAPKLSKEQLLQLAIFYQAYPTNASLGDHLDLVALTLTVCEFGGENLDMVEDIWCGYDNTPEEHQEVALARVAGTFTVHTADASQKARLSKSAISRAHYEIKYIPLDTPGIGMLIETRHGRHPHIIAVCPALKH